jgi:hypothetical protein
MGPHHPPPISPHSVPCRTAESSTSTCWLQPKDCDPTSFRQRARVTPPRLRRVTFANTDPAQNPPSDARFLAWETPRVEKPDRSYARSGNVFVAYQAFGAGPFDVVVVPGFLSNIEFGWEFES